MKDAIYQRGQFNATTIKYNGITCQIVTPITVSTPPAKTDGTKSIQLFGIWDTGATGSCISQKYAQELGLQPVDFRNTYGVGGSIERVPVYEIVVNLNENVKNIHVLAGEAKLHHDDGGPPDSQVGFLIGMDIISLGDFFVGRYKNEQKEECSIYSFRIPSACDPVDYLKEVRMFNAKNNLAKQKENTRQFLNKKHR